MINPLTKNIFFSCGWFDISVCALHRMAPRKVEEKIWPWKWFCIAKKLSNIPGTIYGRKKRKMLFSAPWENKRKTLDFLAKKGASWGKNIFLHEEVPSVYLPARVRPGAKLEVTKLIVKGKPCNVDLTRAFEYSRWHIKTFPVAGHDHVRLECAVKFFVRTSQNNS